MKLSMFDFDLPGRLIAQRPLPVRDQSRMMVVNRTARSAEDRRFAELPEILPSGSFLVTNNTRVFPARLWANRPDRSERIEILLLRQETDGSWCALVRPGRKARAGQLLDVAGLRAEVVAESPDGRRVLRFADPAAVLPLAEACGEPPLPPYIRRVKGSDFGADRLRYQTVYASQTGSIAAPTAGLHFTPAVLEELERRGIPKTEILLHVGYGTFQPVRSEEIEDHRMEPEYCEIGAEAARAIHSRKEAGGRLLAVGTTTTRALEFWAREGRYGEGYAGPCNLFIHHGFQFRMVDALLTNFHLPRSTLLMLVSAFAGHDFVMECYREAVRREYRFFSYGDCMLLL